MKYTDQMPQEDLERLLTNKMKSDLVETLKAVQVLVRGSSKDKLEQVRPKIHELLKELCG